MSGHRNRRVHREELWRSIGAIRQIRCLESGDYACGHYRPVKVHRCSAAFSNGDHRMLLSSEFGAAIWYSSLQFEELFLRMTAVHELLPICS